MCMCMMACGWNDDSSLDKFPDPSFLSWNYNFWKKAKQKQNWMIKDNAKQTQYILISSFITTKKKPCLVFLGPYGEENCDKCFVWFLSDSLIFYLNNQNGHLQIEI